jgi:predicted RND superfamily exporter protein
MNDAAFLRYLDSVQRFAESRPEPTGVYSYAQLLAMVNQIWEGGAPPALRLPENPLLVALFATAIRSYDFPFLQALADAEQRKAQLVIRTRDMPAADYLKLIEEIGAFAEQTKPPGVTVSTARGLHTILEADRRIMRSQVNSVGSAVAAIVLVLAALWRSLRLAVWAGITNGVPVALVLALAGWAGWPLNSITVMMGAIALGIVEDDTIHFITHWRTQRRAGADPEAALRDTLMVKGRPILATTAILVAVFALFGLSSFPPVHQFGLLLAGAFVAAQVAVLVWLPALLRRG